MNKFLSQLRKLEGAVKGDYNPLEHCLQSPSPSMNWAFANPGHGLPFGFSCILFGPPKGGKSLVSNAFVSELHKTDPEAIAIAFNTELRGQLQANDEGLRRWGIDPDRYVVYDVNQPELIFDRIEKDIAALCQEGAKIKMITIDSLSGILGRRTMNADTVLTQQIGDQALTLKDGLNRILPTIRKYGIALIMTAQVRAEMDPKEQMRGKTVKMAGNWATKHMAEYFVFVEPNRSKDGRTTLTGEEFLDEESKDLMDKAEKTGHKIRFRVEESSCGVSGRTAEFTLDYERGIINTHEEVFQLAKNTGVLTKPNNIMYQYKDKSWKGLAATLAAIQQDPALAAAMLADVYAKDAVTVVPTEG